MEESGVKGWLLKPGPFRRLHMLLLLVLTASFLWMSYEVRNPPHVTVKIVCFQVGGVLHCSNDTSVMPTVRS